MKEQNFDVVIGGAGPAGSSAAIILAKAGHRVALVDPVAPEQWKVGESLPGAAMRLLRRLGIPDLEELMGKGNVKSCVANASAWKSERWHYQDALMSPEGGGWHLMRHLFDEGLRKKAREAGVHFISARIHDITQTSARFEVVLKPEEVDSFQASWLIDATGRSAVVARRLGAQKAPIDRQLAAYVWLSPQLGDVDNTTRVKSVPDGWWYTSRLPNSSRVLAFHGAADRVGQMVKDPLLFLNACNQTDLLPYPIQLMPQHLIGPIRSHDAGVSKLAQPFGKNWLAIGDAALSFDPLSSQGIFFALYSGVRGAEALLQAWEQPSATDKVMAHYAQLVQKVFEANMERRRYYYAT